MTGPLWDQRTVTLPARARGLHDITRTVGEVVDGSGVGTGLCHVFLQHTSASLVIQENADPDVLARTSAIGSAGRRPTGTRDIGTMPKAPTI